MKVDELFAFIHERWLIQQRRAAGQPKPWTTNKVLQQFRFTSVYREDDAVTRWITENWRMPHKNDPDLWFGLTLARFFNLPGALAAVGYPVPYVPARVARRLQLYKKEHGGVFNAAYMVRSDPGDKITYVLEKVLVPLWHDRKDIRPRAGDRLEQFYNRLLPYYGMGSFMCAQIVADLKYVAPLSKATDWWTWAASGPGSRRGLNRLLGRPLNAPWKEEEWLSQARILQIKLDPLLREAGMPRMHLQDVQSIGMCEWDKMCRAVSGEGRPKQKYPGV